MLMDAEPEIRFEIVARALARNKRRPRRTHAGKPLVQNWWKRRLPVSYVQHKALEREEGRYVA